MMDMSGIMTTSLARCPQNVQLMKNFIRGDRS